MIKRVLVSMSDLQTNGIAQEAATQVYGLLKDVRDAGLIQVGKRCGERKWSRHAILGRCVHHMKGAANRRPKNQVAGRGGEHAAQLSATS